MKNRSVLCEHRSLGRRQGVLARAPYRLEQALTARTVERLGAGLTADMNRPDDAVLKLNALLERDHFAAAAGRFATRYVGFDPAQQIDRVVARIEALLGTRAL